MRWVLLNLTFLLVGALLYRQGIIRQAWDGDTTWFSTVIIAFVLIGFLMCGLRTLQCSVMLDSIQSSKKGRVKEYMLSKRDLLAKETLRAKLDARLLPIEWLAYVLVTLGFLAIIWGMKNGLYEIKDTPIHDADGAVKIVQILVNHFAIALWPTVTGIAGYVVLQFNIVLLMGGYNRLYTKLLEEVS